MTMIQGEIATFTGLLVLVGLLQWWLIRRQDEHFRVTERAWILAELGWYKDRGKGNVIMLTTKKDDLVEEITDINVKLTCRNEGRSPAWIDEVHGCVEIVTRGSAIRIPEKKNLRTFGPIEPLGANKERSRVLEMQCAGHGKENEFMSVYVIVEYRDIFSKKRETFLGYTIDSDGGIYRQLALPERNRN